MDLLVFKGDQFFIDRKFEVTIFQKEENKYMCFNTTERNFAKIKCKFFLRLQNHGYEKKFLTKKKYIWFKKETFSQFQ